MTTILILHVFATWFMTGLCVFVQLVHYPLFMYVPLKDFAKYELKNFATGFITIPVMIVEMLTGGLLLFWDFVWVYQLNMLLLLIIGLSTFLLQVPLHLSLLQAPEQAKIRRLIHSNWIRTIAWVLRSLLLAYWLFVLLSER